MSKVEILGVYIDDLNTQEILERIEGFLIDGKKHQVVTVNPEFVVLSQKNEEFKKVLNKADLAIVDGVGMVFASIIIHQKKINRVPGTDLLLKIAKLCEDKNYKMYFLGGNPSWVSAKAANTLGRRFPHLLVASHPGPRNISKSHKMEHACIKATINKFKPDFLFVAYGAPHQDLWIIKNLPELDIKVAMGIGGAFNYIIGRSSRAPAILRRVGLEWLWRLFTEPRYRWRRIANAVVVFPWLVILEKVKVQKSKIRGRIIDD